MIMEVKMLVQKAINIFLAEQEARNNSSKTIAVYKQRLGYFSKFIPYIDISELQYSDVQRYIVWLKGKVKNSNHPYAVVRNEQLSDTTIQSYIRDVRSFVNFCIERKYITNDSFDYFRLPKAKKTIIEILDDETIKNLFKFCDKNNNKKIALRNKIIISLMVDCGLRVNEVVTLKISDIKIKENILKVLGKGNKERYVPFGDFTAKLLNDYIKKYCKKNQEILLINEYGNPVGYYGVKKLFQKIRKYTRNDKIHPHLLRHTFATKYLINGGDITSLKMILGHTSLKMVEHYLHLAEQFTINKYKQYSIMDNIRTH